jgi:hypothetical protein
MRAAYKVGFKKPPKNAQFKKGESGNPRGRRKGAKNLKTELAGLMEEKTPLMIEGKKRMVSRRLALLLRLMSDAFRGNVKAASKLLDLDFRYSADAPELASDALQDLAARDQQIIERFLARHGVSASKKGATRS